MTRSRVVPAAAAVEGWTQARPVWAGTAEVDGNGAGLPGLPVAAGAADTGPGDREEQLSSRCPTSGGRRENRTRERQTGGPTSPAGLEGGADTTRRQYTREREAGERPTHRSNAMKRYTTAVATALAVAILSLAAAESRRGAELPRPPAAPHRTGRPKQRRRLAGHRALRGAVPGPSPCTAPDAGSPPPSVPLERPRRRGLCRARRRRPLPGDRADASPGPRRGPRDRPHRGRSREHGRPARPSQLLRQESPRSPCSGAGWTRSSRRKRPSRSFERYFADTVTGVLHARGSEHRVPENERVVVSDPADPAAAGYKRCMVCFQPPPRVDGLGLRGRPTARGDSASVRAEFRISAGPRSPTPCCKNWARRCWRPGRRR